MDNEFIKQRIEYELIKLKKSLNLLGVEFKPNQSYSGYLVNKNNKEIEGFVFDLNDIDWSNEK